MHSKTFIGNTNKINWHGFFTGMWFFLPIMFVYFRDHDLTYAQIGLLFTVQNIFKLLVEVPSGAFADHFGRKWAMAISNVCFVLCFLLLGFGGGFYAFLLAHLFKGVGQAFNSGSDSALVYDSLMEQKIADRFSHFFGQRWGFTQFGFAASALAAVFIVGWDIKLAFILSAIANLIALIFILSVKEPPLHKRQEINHPFEFFWSAVKFTINHDFVRWFLGFYVLSLLGITSVFQYLQYFLQEFDVAKDDMGYFYALFTAVSALGSLFANRIGTFLGEKRTLLFVFFSVLLCLSGTSQSYNLGVFLCFVMLLQLQFGFSAVILNHYFHRHVDSHHRATVHSLRQFIYGISMAILAPCMGYISDTMDYRIALFGLSILYLFLNLVPTIQILRRLIRP